MGFSLLKLHLSEPLIKYLGFSKAIIRIISITIGFIGLTSLINLPNIHCKATPVGGTVTRSLWNLLSNPRTREYNLNLNSHDKPQLASPYGNFPLPTDPFSFIPCTNRTFPPPLDDTDWKQTWATLFDPNPDHWSWGSSPPGNASRGPYTRRGIYLCGFLDMPLDYRNSSDSRIVRLAVTKFQVSGLARVDELGGGLLNPVDGKSERTIVIEPGGPGASGTVSVWQDAETITKRLSDGQFDVLGWDPRGVNVSLPSAACFPHNSYRDHWSLLRGQYREESNHVAQLKVADAMNNATLYACLQQLGDFGRFISTSSVARDLEEIRKSLREKELTAYFVSYGTGLGEIFANMFPQNVGRMIFDGPQYVKDKRSLRGWGWSSFENVTDTWHGGFLGECVKASPERCALAKSTEDGSNPATIEDLETRIGALFQSILAQPVPAYTEQGGPTLITYSQLISAIYVSLYDPSTWPATAQMLHDLEAGNTTAAAITLERQWRYKPATSSPSDKPSSDELLSLVLCADAYDSPRPEDGLEWWDELWANMTERSWIAGNSRFYGVLPCRHFNTYWSSPAELYRGELNSTLSNPILIIALTYDPATPLNNGKRLLQVMGENARLVVHHGYGHTSRFDKSSCTDSIAKAYILNGTLPQGQESECYADAAPYSDVIDGVETI